MHSFIRMAGIVQWFSRRFLHQQLFFRVHPLHLSCIMTHCCERAFVFQVICPLSRAQILPHHSPLLHPFFTFPSGKYYTTYKKKNVLLKAPLSFFSSLSFPFSKKKGPTFPALHKEDRPPFPTARCFAKNFLINPPLEKGGGIFLK